MRSSPHKKPKKGKVLAEEVHCTPLPDCDNNTPAIAEEPDEGLVNTLEALSGMIDEAVSNAGLREHILGAIGEIDMQFDGGEHNDRLGNLSTRTNEFLGVATEKPPRRSRREQIEHLSHQKAEIERLISLLPVDERAERIRMNVDVLSGIFDLPADEARLLRMITLMSENKFFARFIEQCFNDATSREAVICSLTGATRRRAAEIMNGRCRAVRAGILSVCEDLSGFENLFELRPSILVKLQGSAFTAEDLFASILPSVPEPRITAEDVPHLAAEIDLCTRALRGAMYAPFPPH